MDPQIELDVPENATIRTLLIELTGRNQGLDETDVCRS